MLASKFRYSAAHLFYLLSLCASAIALWGWLGIPVACFVALVWVQILSGIEREAQQAQTSCGTSSPANPTPANPVPAQTGKPPLIAACLARYTTRRLRRRGISKPELLLVLLMGGLLIGISLPATSEYDPMQQADISMQMVARALATYEAQYGRPPPAVIYDQHGVAQHSWRAVLLPYLGEEKLAAAYRWDEPWNGPHNSQLTEFCPWHYRTFCPQQSPPRGSTALHLLSDQDQNTFVVEHEAGWSHWLQPTEPPSWQHFEKVPAAEQGFWKRNFFASSYRGRLAVSARQTVVIHPSPSAETQSAPSHLASQLAAVELQAQRDQLEFSQVGRPHLQVHYDNALRLVVFLAIALYPLRWLTRHP